MWHILSTHNSRMDHRQNETTVIMPGRPLDVLYVPKHTQSGHSTDVKGPTKVLYTGRRYHSPERMGVVHLFQEMQATHPSCQIEFDRPITRSKAREARSLHPWEFSHNQNVASMAKSQHTPFWRQASHPISSIHVDPCNTNLQSDGSRAVIWMEGRHKSTTIREDVISSKITFDTDKALLQKYKTVAELCSKCRRHFLPQWRKVRNEFKKLQIQSNKGCISAKDFSHILEFLEVPVSHEEVDKLKRLFKCDRDINITRYDEFLRVCFVAKPSNI